MKLIGGNDLTTIVLQSARWGSKGRDVFGEGKIYGQRHEWLSGKGDSPSHSRLRLDWLPLGTSDSLRPFERRLLVTQVNTFQKKLASLLCSRRRSKVKEVKGLHGGWQLARITSEDQDHFAVDQWHRRYMDQSERKAQARGRPGVVFYKPRWLGPYIT